MVVDIKKIFLTPPHTKRELITVLLVMVAVFMICFGPLCFSPIHPIKAVVISCLPALSLSWGWLVLLRALFSKREYSKKQG